jgi:thioredoxin 2
LFIGEPVELDLNNFQTQIDRSDIPVVIDCWAPWCGPCRAMGPAFAQSARLLEPRYRLAKLDTERFPSLAAPFNIRSIPTLLMFRSGKETARQSGAMDIHSIVRWVQGQNERPV